jgi:hypothetical protein
MKLTKNFMELLLIINSNYRITNNGIEKYYHLDLDFDELRHKAHKIRIDLEEYQFLTKRVNKLFNYIQEDFNPQFYEENIIKIAKDLKQYYIKKNHLKNILI